ncbi:MAG: STAS domain-containing protein [Paludibacteraceae bacterium]|nr:STAS domain-containing protein [Paludibacteraceae bacterium]
MEIIIKENANSIEGHFVGRLDTVAATKVGSEMAKLGEYADREILLDFAELEFISSSGLRLLLMLNKQSKAKKGKVIIANASDDIKHVLKLTGFISLFEIR